MSVIGIGCRLDKGEAVVVGVQVTGPVASCSGVEVFRHRTDPQDSWAQKLALLANDLDTQLARLTPEAIVVRSMDWSAARREQTVRPRYQVEGVILAIARRRLPDVEARSGREIGTLCRSSKPEVESLAAAHLLGLDRDAATAAIGALFLVGQE